MFPCVVCRANAEFLCVDSISATNWLQYDLVISAGLCPPLPSLLSGLSCRLTRRCLFKNVGITMLLNFIG